MKVPMRLRPGRGGRDLGAAAVEFALVVPILLLLVMGILDYGRYFFDSISLRQGVREAARQVVVQSYPTACTPATAPTDGTNVGANIACSARAASVPVIMGVGTLAVKVPAITAVGGWKQGNQLLVCLASKEHGTGFVPLPGGGLIPGDGFIKTKVYMSIEKGSPVIVPSYSSDADPDTDATTGNWTWCA